MIVAVLTFYQVFTQGIFSALLMAVFSVVAALVSMNYFEPLGGWLVTVGLPASGIQAIALLVLFAAILFAFRFVSDKFVKGNMNFPVIIDRVGATFFGLISSLTIGGVIFMGLQLSAAPARLLGFDRCPTLAKPSEDSSLFPNADGFVTSLMAQASNYCFSGRNNFSQYHPDILREVYLNRLVLDPGSRREAAEDAAEVKNAWLIGDSIIDLEAGQAIGPSRGQTFVGVSLRIKSGKGSDSTGARDPDSAIRFVLGNVRVVGFDREDRRSSGYACYPLGIIQPGGGAFSRVGLDEGKFFSDRAGQIDLLFEWPEDMRKTPPLFLEFKRSARADMPGVARLKAALPKTSDIFADSVTASEGAVRKPPEADAPYSCKELVFYEVLDESVLKKLSVPSEKALADAKSVSRKTIAGDKGYQYVHVHLEAKRATRSETPEFKSLHVPEGYALMVLHIEFRSAQGLGAVILPRLVDTFGRTYVHAGYSAAGKAGRQNYLEFAYASPEVLQLKALQQYERPFPSKAAEPEEEAKIEKVVLYYVIAKQPEQPIGIIGCRSYTSHLDVGQLWHLGGGLDAVVVPAK